MADEKPKRRRRVAQRDEDGGSTDAEAKSEQRSGDRAEHADEDEDRGSEDEDRGSAEGASTKRERPSRRASGAQLARRASRELAEITGLKPESVTSLERADDGGWRVTVELLELSRVPDTDDILGSYRAELDENGELLSYQRLRRYARSHASEERSEEGG